MQSLFGLVVAGRNVTTDWFPTSETRCISELSEPTLTNEITFFLLPQVSIPPGHGAVLYFSKAPMFDQWEMIGAVTPEKPSGIFRTGWSTKEDMVGCPMVQLGVSLEPYETISNLEIMNSGVDERKEFAIKIAKDLFLYMTSFSQQTQMGEMLLVPTNILDRWIDRFQRKYSLDPNFMMKDQT